MKEKSEAAPVDLEKPDAKADKPEKPESVVVNLGDTEAEAFQKLATVADHALMELGNIAVEEEDLQERKAQALKKVQQTGGNLRSAVIAKVQLLGHDPARVRGWNFEKKTITLR